MLLQSKVTHTHTHTQAGRQAKLPVPYLPVPTYLRRYPKLPTLPAYLPAYLPVSQPDRKRFRFSSFHLFIFHFHFPFSFSVQNLVILPIREVSRYVHW